MKQLPTLDELREMKIVGYLDASFFRSHIQSSGVILRDNSGRVINLSHAEIAKIRNSSDLRKENL